MAIRKSSQVDLAPLLAVGVVGILGVGLWGSIEFFKYLRKDKQPPAPAPSPPPPDGETPSS